MNIVNHPFVFAGGRGPVHLAGWFMVLSVLLLSGCGTLNGPPPQPPTPTASIPTTPPKAKPSAEGNTQTAPGGGGYYKDDGPGTNPPENIEEIPNAQPKAEPLHRYANRPYVVFGKSYRPMTEAGNYKKQGRASWYGKRFHGKKTSTGEEYDMYAMTAAHPTLPLPSYARVTNLSNGKSVVVRVNDRGPFHSDRIIDLSWTAASKLGYIGKGSTLVEVVSLRPGEDKSLPSEPLAAATNAAIPPVAAESADPVSGAWLQLGAFGRRDNAEAMKSRLFAQLGDLGDKLAVRASGNLYRVQLGPWADAVEARNIAERLASQHEVKAVLVQ